VDPGSGSEGSLKFSKIMMWFKAMTDVLATRIDTVDMLMVKVMYVSRGSISKDEGHAI
jgi:hypothetical protein